MILRQAVLAGIDIDTDKTPSGKSVDTDVALGNHRETAPASWVLLVIASSKVDLWSGQDMHIEHVRQILETMEDELLVVQLFKIPSVAIEGQVFSEMRHRYQKMAN